MSEHRYRISGHVRLLLFWVSSDQVGSARITWSADEDAGRSALSLLIGSDPKRAPRRVNEWGYVREETHGDSAAVVGMRTATEGDSPEEADANRAKPGTLADVGILCSSLDGTAAESWTTTVRIGQDATYRHVSHVLDQIAADTRWTEVRTTRPSEVSAGFLGALDRMLRAAADSALGGGAIAPMPSTAYFYKDAVYDLSIRRSERVAQVRTRSGVIDNAVRSEFVITNRKSRSSSRFWIVYGIDGSLAGVPLRAGSQPKWWFKIELELDDLIDAPADPAVDESTRLRLNELCQR